MNNFQEQLTKVGHQRTSALAHSLENLQPFPARGSARRDESGAQMVWHRVVSDSESHEAKWV